MIAQPEIRPDVDAVRQRLAEIHVADYEGIGDEYEISEPRKVIVPHIWKWDDLKELLSYGSSGREVGDISRRSLGLQNPGLSEPWATRTLYASYSMYNPGEVAKVHRHTSSASRFVLEGRGGYTTIDGEKIKMSRGDLVITPNGTWHDHGSDGPDPVVWVDVLDAPIVDFLSGIFAEWDFVEPESPGRNTTESLVPGAQNVRKPDDYSSMLYDAGGIVPRFGPAERFNRVGTAQYVYRWRAARELMERLSWESGSPYDGINIEYVDPNSGASVVPSMSFQAMMLRPGEETWDKRHTASSVYCAIEGSGYTEIGGKRFDWNANDVFVVPGWSWHRHANRSKSNNAFLYRVTDEPTLKKLRIYRAQGRSPEGKIEQIQPWPIAP